MGKSLIVTALLLLAGAGAFAQLPQQPQKSSTRFGSLTVNDQRMLLFNGHPLQPPVEGNSSLDLGEPFRIGSTDVVLVTDNGGTACPVLYYFVTVSRWGAKATPSFGTCGEVTNVKRNGNSISLTMPGFQGPFEPEAEKRKAARHRHLFVFRDGVVTENGKQVK
jgi:hypothetical protein